MSQQMLRTPSTGVLLVCIVVGVAAGEWWFAHLGKERSSLARAETPSSPPAITRIAVVDIAAVMQRIPELRAELTLLQSDMQRVQSQFQKRQTELLSMQKELQALAPDSQEFQQRQQTLQQQMSQLQTEIQLQQREFFERERKAYLAASERINKAVETVAREKGVMIVLRQMRPPTWAANPQELKAYLAREVIWCEPQLDITDEVVKHLGSSGEP